MTSFNTQTGNGIFRIQIETDDYESYLAIQEACRSEIDRSKNRIGVNVDPAEFNTFSNAMMFLNKLKMAKSKGREIVTVAQYYILLGKRPTPEHYDYGWPANNIISSRCIYHIEDFLELDGETKELKKAYVVDLGKPIRIDWVN